MGCTSSKEADEVARPRRGLVNRPMEDRVWTTDGDWANTNELFRQYTSEHEDGRSLVLESREPDIFFASVGTWLEHNFRDCAYRNTIEQLGGQNVQVVGEDGNPQSWPATRFIAMDPWLTGVVVALVFVLAVPVDEKKLWLAPGDMINTKAMEAAKRFLPSLIHDLEQQLDFDAYDSAEMIIVAGADMLRGRWRPSVTAPAITPRTEELPKEAAKKVDRLGKEINLDEPMTLYIPMVLDALLTQLKGFAPDATIWDEGELLFSVQGSPYPYATRLLVTRDEATRNKDVEATEHKIEIPEGHPMAGRPSHILWRNASPEKDPGGIIALSLSISMAASDPWPKVGSFAKGPVMKAAADALLDLLKEWHRLGKLQRCVAKVDMGFDTLRYSFVGNRLEADSNSVPSGKVPVLKKPEGAMEGFFMKMVDIPKHQLFDSEEHFQSIKSIMSERMLQNPERFKARALDMGKHSAAYLLELNYPGAEISFMGDLPITFDGYDPKTALVVAKHPNKTENEIISVIYCIPSPDGELGIDPTGKRKNWLGTEEAKVGVAKLLEKMQQWQRAGRITEGECIAQLMIGVDADVYLFVDGSFEEPSEERLAQFKWG